MRNACSHDVGRAADVRRTCGWEGIVMMRDGLYWCGLWRTVLVWLMIGVSGELYWCGS